MSPPVTPSAIPAGTPLPEALDAVLDAATAVDDPVARTAALVALTDALNGPQGLAHRTRVALTQTLRERVAAGSTQSSLATELGLTRQRLSQLVTRDDPRRRRLEPAAQRVLVAALRARHAAGATLVELAEECGVTRQTVARWLAHGDDEGRRSSRFADDWDAPIIITPEHQVPTDA
ncbi:helix-turn-helix domain-containing protein [Actinotalea sp. JY-7885]|uniref:helix-turn-helix domain-containing protein n=1 Tax=Actinotalea sp. JY-7885 TaxID=2758576 RepID=UPI00165E6280|nr:helix-turn-helix domain-containing protein [Actinotalea sp. JY-7885]